MLYPFPWKISWISNKLTIWSKKYAETILSIDVLYRCVLRTIGNRFSKAWLKETYEPWGTDIVQEQVLQHVCYSAKVMQVKCANFVFCFVSIFWGKFSCGLSHVLVSNKGNFIELWYLHVPWSSLGCVSVVVWWPVRYKLFAYNKL